MTLQEQNDFIAETVTINYDYQAEKARFLKLWRGRFEGLTRAEAVQVRRKNWTSYAPEMQKRAYWNAYKKAFLELQGNEKP